MKTFEQIYEPYNFSATRCHVFTFNIEKKGFKKIEYNLPIHVKDMKGVFVSTDCTIGVTPLVGLISLNFNGQAFKSFQAFVYENNSLTDNSHPFEFNETILPNSFIQGFFYDLSKSKFYPYKVTVYLHYTNLEYKPL